ncbi:MAG TPA: O-antigen ligase family protein [Vicinamibacterales bacterium]|nr:O-antigen ligase family protein [Vicinamibacterales bacterium]
MKTRGTTLETAGFVFIALSLGLVQLSLFTAQSVLFSLAAIVWLIVAIREGVRPQVPAFFLPLTIYAGLTLVSAAFSADPIAGFSDSRQLLMFLMVPIVARFARGSRASTTIDIIIAIGSAGAVLGIIQFAMLGYDNLDNRPDGLLSIYMTYAGVLMLVTCAAVARLVFGRVRSPWPIVAVPALLVALAVTLTRNAWIGTLLGITVLLTIRNWKFIIVPPVLAALAFAVAPGQIQQRAQSFLNSNDPASRDRKVMWKIGADMVRDHPLLGVGPVLIEPNYQAYRQKYPDAVNATNPHLHNVPIQIAAERGIPALLVWLWFIAVAARDLWRQLRRGQAPTIAGAGLAAIVAMLAAGMFEYNFGDSEFLMLFLGLITLPFAATLGAAGERAGADASPQRAG